MMIFPILMTKPWPAIPADAIKDVFFSISPPHMGGEEMRFVREAFESNYIAPLGPMVDAFEKEFGEYVGMKHCAAVSSGTAAMPWWNSKNKGIPLGKHLGWVGLFS